MSARKSAKPTPHTFQPRSAHLKHTAPQPVNPRKRPVRDEESSSLSSESSSEESSRMITTFKEEDGNNPLRMNQGSKATPTESKRLKTSDVPSSAKKIPEDEEEENAIDSTSSQQRPQEAANTFYLNAESLSALQKVNDKQKLNLQSYIKQMVQTENRHGIELFKRKPDLNIELLQNRGTPHLLRNKVSDKFNRRDVQFYDLYVKRDNSGDLALLKENQFPLEIDAYQYYHELEMNDFNQVFTNEDLIAEKFGNSINITLEQKLGGTITRSVVERTELVKQNDTGEFSHGKNSSGKAEQTDDPDLISLDAQLKQLGKEFAKTTAEIADIFCKVSGRLNKMREYLENRPNVVEWNYLEDLALTKPDESAEFQVLLQTKGIEEIRIRREFLQATPEVCEEDDQKEQK